jgi:hypothetical protein
MIVVGRFRARHAPKPQWRTQRVGAYVVDLLPVLTHINHALPSSVCKAGLR